jgi:hypothetical protein
MMIATFSIVLLFAQNRESALTNHYDLGVSQTGRYYLCRGTHEFKPECRIITE